MGWERAMLCMKGLVSKGTERLRCRGSATQKFGIKRVDKGHIFTFKSKEADGSGVGPSSERMNCYAVKNFII